jgi:GT2 family glycosyltransferase
VIVSVIIVTFNGAKWIDNCLKSVYESDIPVDVIIIDNDSNDNTLDIIRSNYERAKVFSTGENLGFGKANNIGIAHAINSGAEYIYLLNQDAYVEISTIRELIVLSKRNIDYGILSPIQLNGIGTKYDYNFKNIIETIDSTPHKEPLVAVNFVMAAHWLITRHCISKVGMFDPIFAHYGEDNDYCNRVRYHDMKIGIANDVVAYHDREDRKFDIEKKINQMYRSGIAILTNINFSLVHCIGSFLHFSFRLLIRYRKYWNYSFWKQVYSLNYFIFSNFRAILKRRKENKIQGI